MNKGKKKYQYLLNNFLIIYRDSHLKRGCVIIDYGHLWCTLLLYIV